MIRAQGTPFDELTMAIDAFEAKFLGLVAQVMDEVAGELGAVTVAAAPPPSDQPVEPEPPPGEPYVSLDTLALIATLWSAVVIADLVPDIEAAYLRGAAAIAESVTAELAKIGQEVPSASVELTTNLAEQYLAAAKNRMTGFSDAMWEIARAQLLEGFMLGESIPKLRDRLRNVADLSAPRASTVARTEIVSASNAGSLGFVQMMNFGGVKEWLATDDLRTRETHTIADGQKMPVGVPFIVGGFPLMFPGDPAGPPQEIINCRCTLTYELSDEPLTAAGSDDFDCTSGVVEFCRDPLHPGVCKGYKRGGKVAEVVKKVAETSPTKAGPVKSYNTPDTAKSFIDQHFGQWRKDLTSSEDASIRFYQSPGFALMNGQLRGLSKSDIKADVSFNDADLARAKKASSALKKAISSAPPLTEDVEVYRGFSADQFGQLKPGMTIKDKGFVSTSLTSKDIGSVGKAKSPAIATIRLPRGSKVGAGSSRELIIPPGSSFKVHKVSKKGGTTHVELELVK